MHKPHIAIGAIGGTISMQSDAAASGVKPTLPIEAMLEAVPKLAGLATIEAETIRLVPSASLDFALLLDVLRWARGQVARGADGVVILQGTDTLEETSFFLDLLWDSDKPLVLTGAMRNASQAGADGPSNLWAAALVAAARDASRHRGVMVVFNDQIHEARWVRKTHTSSVAAFVSPVFGPCGAVLEDGVRYFRAPSPRAPFPTPEAIRPRVALIECALSDGTELLDFAMGEGRYDGLVVAAFGAGHVSEAWADRMKQGVQAMPVIVASRTGAGSTARTTYGYKGGEIDLIESGMVMAGFLCPLKARILLTLLLEQPRPDIERAFAQFNTLP